MTFRRKRVPSYRLHKASGQAIVTLSNGLGSRRDVLLGKYGTAASRAEYARVVGEWEANGRRLQTTTAADLTIAELIERYWPVVEETYRHADGTPTSEVLQYKYTLRALRYRYGDSPAKQFGPLALKAVRQLMIDGYKHPKYGVQRPLARGVINKRVARIKHIMKWAVSNELLPAVVYHGLLTVEGLRRGRSTARETEPVKPVPRAIVEQTLPILRPTVADMVRLQLETGMRSGELVIIQPIDIDMTGPVWIYRPQRHKTEHHGHQRTIAIGPRGQQIVRKYLTTNIHAYLFAPAKDMEARKQERRARRKSKVQPSQQDRTRKGARRKPGSVYTPTAYAQSIRDAIRRHNLKSRPEEHLPHWHPHQLRHTRAAEVRRAAGLDAARAALGHRSPIVTEHYAQLDLAAAAEVMLRIG